MLVPEGCTMTVVGQDPRAVVHDLVTGVVPLDEHEAQDKTTTLRWVRSGAPLFRIARPATPEQHLCVYFALFDGGADPLFLTVTRTRGEHSHTDVSFWFVLAADQDMRIEADPREANEVRWFALDDSAEWAHDRFDPHMARFRDKLLARLGTPALVG
jgi:8-oxo-dGTP diphosphatase